MAKISKITDPCAEREAKTYENPIPSRECIMEYLRQRNLPAKKEELYEVLQLATAEQQEALRRRLRAMERDGQLVLTRRGGYGLAEKMDLVHGRVSGHKDGFGFVVAEDGGSDLFLNARQMRSVFHGDRVLVRVAGIDHKGRREATIVEILERPTTSLVGRYGLENNVGYVIPDNKHFTHAILIPAGEEGNARQGQIVVTEIVSPPTLRTQAIGRIIEVLGEHMAPGMEIEIALRNYRIPHTWSPTVLAEADLLPKTVVVADLENRVDLRHLPFVTIDGEDAQDFDDAVYCKAEKNGSWILYVAIADVSHYVKVDTALDQEALKRGNSVYFPGQVVPMLPEALANNLCSLKPHVDRLSLVCEMKISNTGKLQRYKFYHAVIHSQARLTYTEVAAVLNDEPNNKNKENKSAWVPYVTELANLYQVLWQAREVRGAIDFATTETRVIFGANRKIEQIVPVQRNIAHRIIEECMLMANVAAAKFTLKLHLPVLFRIHAEPTAAKINDLREFLASVGLRLPGTKKISPADYAALVKSIQSRPDAHLIQMVLLRSLSQAVYSPDNIGHFGLAFKSYAHFTSPIRRYPDLLLHRVISQALQNAMVEDANYDKLKMVKLGEHCSMIERRADEATRETLDWLKCEFIQDHLGKEFDGLITNVTSFGLFVELENIYIEGLVHVTALKNDYYHFDPLKHRLQGERTGIIYRLGDKIRVRVTRVNLEDRQIDFDLVVSSQQAIIKKTKAKKLKPKKSASKKLKKKHRYY